MVVHMQCEGCGKRLRADDALAGKKGRCPDCQRIMTVESIATLQPDRAGPGNASLITWLLLAALLALIYLNL